MTATPAEVLAAIELLANCDHFDNSRRAARALPHDFPIAELQRAADGAALIARALTIHRRTAA